MKDRPVAPGSDTASTTVSILRKAHESTSTLTAFFEKNAVAIDELAQVMAERFQNGGRLFVMGNGGSACDAEHMAVEFMHPIFEKRAPLPCIALPTSAALASAISNDIDFSRTFALPLKQLAAGGDMALAISTSGMSPNLIAALECARGLGLLTVAFSGKDGGRLVKVADHALTVRSYSIHRIQECHTALLHILWDAIHLKLGEEDIV